MGTITRILIVDDDVVDLETTRRLLSSSTRMKSRVDSATCLRSAVELLGSSRYDVLLLDLNLPGSHGLATLDTVRAATSNLPIIVLSSLSDEKTALCSLDHGAQDYLVKGQVATESLTNAIRYAIQRQQLLEEITDAKEMLERKNQRLAELYETAHRFVDNVSHEFRTPLTVIKEYASLVRDGYVETAAEQQHFLDIVSDRADDLNRMVDDMLDVSKLEAGLLGAWRRVCDLSAILNNLRPALQRKAAVKGVTLDMHVDPDVPQVYCDDEKVGRVLINLAVNAIKFSPQDGHVSIWARKCANAPGAVIGVTDNGPGIDAENLAKLFGRFQQVGGDIRGDCKGFGLGLNIAKELVDINFGEIRVESQVGQGSTFTFTLPPNEPFEVMRRYLKQVGQLRIGSSKLSLVRTTIDDSCSMPTADDVSSFLNLLLKRNDLVFRVATHEWLVVLAANESEVEQFYARAHKTLQDVNRNRVRGPLPPVVFESIGTWHGADQFREVQASLRQVFATPETTHA